VRSRVPLMFNPCAFVNSSTQFVRCHRWLRALVLLIGLSARTAAGTADKLEPADKA